MNTILATISIVGIVLLVVMLVLLFTMVAKNAGNFGPVTRMLFVTTQVAALGWVSVSYLIALYSTVKLQEPFPVVELSQQAITAILGANTLKVVENIFEHNNGKFFGASDEIRNNAPI